MGLREFFFGPKLPEDLELTESEEEKEHPHYGRLAERGGLTEELHAENAEKQEEKEGGNTGAAPHLRGLERTAGRLAGRVRGEQLPKWSKITRKLGKLERKFEGAESAEDVRKIAKQALTPRGLFRKIERGMEKRLTTLEGEGASKGEIRRYERDLRKLERRLQRPTRFLR